MVRYLCVEVCFIGSRPQKTPCFVAQLRGTPLVLAIICSGGASPEETRLRVKESIYDIIFGTCRSELQQFFDAKLSKIDGAITRRRKVTMGARSIFKSWYYLPPTIMLSEILVSMRRL